MKSREEETEGREEKKVDHIREGRGGKRVRDESRQDENRGPEMRAERRGEEDEREERIESRDRSAEL